MAATATGPRYAPEDPTLPKPWKGLVDGKTGYLYFWNPETNVTQYERPSGSSNTSLAPPPKSSASISSSVQVQQSSQGQRRDHGLNEEDDKYNRARNLQQSARGGTVHSHDTPNGMVGAGHGGSSVRGQGSLGQGSGVSAESYRRRHEITVTGDDVPQPFISFEATGFPPEILKEVYSAGFSAPTPIQAQSWPVALQSRDIVAIAKTGSGKTLGYLIPGFIHLKRIRNNPQMGPTVLVLSPTRELATQIQDEAVKFARSSRISCTCLYGGAPKGPQLRDLDRGADIVVATPGRLNDILEMRRVSLRQVSYLVLDEADRMLDMGFEPQIRKIVKEVPTRRQTLMYTATWPKEVRKIAADLLVNPVQVNIGNVDELVANKAITQYVEVLPYMEKHKRLEQILHSQEPGSKIIIFCSTKKMCDQLARNLTRPFGAAAIHGDKSQGERDYVLNQFRTGRSPVLVATDVAARGLDIKDIRVVINYDFPTGIEDYVHRIGRTGRAGATGLAYTFFADQDAKYASDLVKVLEGANQRVPPEIRDMAARGGGGMGRSRRWGSSTGGRDGGRGGGRNDSSYGGSSYGGGGSSYGARDGGRGGWGMPPSSSGRGGRGADQDPQDRSYHASSFRARSRSRSRSPNRGGQQGNGDLRNNRSRSGSWNGGRSRSRSRSRSLERYNKAPPPVREKQRSPVYSFHKAAMEQSRSSPPRRYDNVRERSPVRSFHKSFTEQKPYNKDTRGLKNSPERSPRSPSGKGKFSGGHDGEVYANGHRASYLGEEEEEGMIPTDDDGTLQAATTTVDSHHSSP